MHRIIVDATSAHTSEEQIARIVVQVREALAVDVCSLYQLDESSRLRMVANVGLAEGSAGRIVLPGDQGLVGMIATRQLPLNLAHAQSHPAYRYFPESGEEAFQAFLGAPIVNLGKTIGVIVVQDHDQRGFSADEESFLVTIAAQLAGSLSQLPAADPAGRSRSERRVEGISGAPGKAIGQLHLVIGGQTLHLVDEPEPRGVTEELILLSNAVRAAQTEIQAGKARLDTLLSADVLALFDFYGQMLENDQLTISAEARIRSGSSAFAAVRASVDEHAAAFEAIEDEYLRARAEDVRHVGQTLLTAILGQSISEMPVMDSVVLLGSAVSITDIAQFDPTQIVAIVCLKGSKLSHTAVLARALGIPAVVATGPIDHIREGDRVIVDGDHARVILNPTRASTAAFEAAILEARFYDRQLEALRDLPAVTTDGRKINLLTNTGLLADISPGISRGAEGVGLYRSEIPFMSVSAFPTESEQTAVYRQVLSAYAPMPVTMRTLDIGSDKQLPYLHIEEDNPALGWRGIRFSLQHRSILVTQLRAMLKASCGLDNLRIMLPMVSTVAECEEAADLLAQLLAELQTEGLSVRRPAFGIMVEVPGVIPLLPHLSGRIDFISVGTNDLVQYLLAVDRTNPYVAAYYDHLHPAVIRALDDLVASARALELDISICGEMASDPEAVVLLVGMGFETLSINAYRLPRIKAIIRQLDTAEARLCVLDALTLADSAAIRARIRPIIERVSPDSVQ